MPCANFSTALGFATGGGNTLHLAPGDYGSQALTLDDDDSGIIVQGDGATPAATRIDALFPGTSGNSNFTVRNLRIVPTVIVRGIVIDSNAQLLTLENVQIAQNGTSTSDQLIFAFGPGTNKYTSLLLRNVDATSAGRAAAIQANGTVTIEDSTLHSTATAATSLLGLSISSGNTSTVRRSRFVQDSTAANSPIIGLSASGGATGGIPNTLIDSSVLRGGSSAIAADSVNPASSGTLHVDVRNSTLFSGATAVTASQSQAGAASVAVTANSSILSPAPTIGTNASGGVTITCAYSAIGGAGPAGCAAGGTNQAFSAAQLASGSEDLAAGAPEIDSGDPAQTGFSATDVKGNVRVVPGDGTCTGGVRDIGAVEYRGGLVITPTITAPATAVTGTAATFSATADKAGAAFAWDFGDSATASGTPVSHTYSAAGSKTVRADATSGLCSGSATKTVAVSAPATATTTATPTPGSGAAPTPTPGANGTPTPTPTPSGSATPTPTPTALTLAAKLKKKSVKRRKKAKLVVTLSAPATVKVVGKRKGHKAVTLVTGKALKAGATTLTLKTRKLGRGKVTLTVTAGGSTKKLTLKIKR